MVRRSGCGWVLLLVSVVWLIPVSVSAQERLNAAVAANFIQAFTEISQAFERKTGVKVEATFASAGSLYGQIANGASYDPFLSADEDRPARLNREGAGNRPPVGLHPETHAASHVRGGVRRLDRLPGSGGDQNKIGISIAWTGNPFTSP